jgi:hypothetical protein
MILNAVPQFASSIMTGSVSGMDGGAVRAAAAAGYGAGMSVWSKSRTMAQGAMGIGSTVSQAAQAYSHTAQAAKDTGSSPGEARKAGAWEAFKTVMTGPQAGGPRAAGDRIYSDHQRAAQFADARNSGADNLSAPPGGTNQTNQADQGKTSSQVSGAAAVGVTIAEAKDAEGMYSSSSGDDEYWGSYASDRKKEGGNKA